MKRLRMRERAELTRVSVIVKMGGSEKQAHARGMNVNSFVIVCVCSIIYRNLDQKSSTPRMALHLASTSLRFFPR